MLKQDSLPPCVAHSLVSHTSLTLYEFLRLLLGTVPATLIEAGYPAL